MHNKSFFVIAIFVLYFQPVFAQDLGRLVTVNYENQSLETILYNLEQEFGLKFTYLPYTISLDSTITLKVSNQSLETLLNVLSVKAGFEYRVVKDHIPLFHSVPPEVEKEHPSEPTAVSLAGVDVAVVMPENMVEEKRQMTIDTVAHEMKYAPLTRISNIDLTMPQHSLSIPSYDSPRDRFAPLPDSSRKTTWSLGPVVAMDVYRMSGKADENKSFTYRTGLNYSAGVSAGLQVKERWHFLVSILYSTKNFELYYNIQTKNDDDPFIPEKTHYKQSYLDIPILLDYRVLERGGWKLFGELGFVPGFLLNSSMQTYHRDGSEMQTEEFLAMKIRPQLFGAQLGMMAEDQITKHFSLTVATGWRHYFNGINKEDLTTKLGLFHCTAGIGYTF